MLFTYVKLWQQVWLYFVSILYCPFFTGYLLGNLIHTLFDSYRASLENVEVIGHSLGAHVAGFAGKRVQNLTGLRIPRITGLDPAGPLFDGFWVSQEERLHEDDAEVVVALHTDSGAAGFEDSIGTIDFYPNGGNPPQPGCIFSRVDFTSKYKIRRVQKCIIMQ